MPGFDSDEQRDDYVRGLRDEAKRLGAQKNPRLADVEAELARITGAPASRARTATSQKATTSRKRAS